MSRTPEVQDGYRSPRDERMSQAKAAEAKRGTGAGFAVIPEGKRIFQFTHSKYRLQLTAPIEHKDSEGRVSRNKAIVVVADEGLKILDEVKDEKTIKMIEQHEHYGVDFWDFASVIESGRRKKAAQAVEILKDPEARRQIIEALRESGEESFALPGAGGPAHVLPSQKATNKPADVE